MSRVATKILGAHRRRERIPVIHPAVTASSFENALMLISIIRLVPRPVSAYNQNFHASLPLSGAGRHQ